MSDPFDFSDVVPRGAAPPGPGFMSVEAPSSGVGVGLPGGTPPADAFNSLPTSGSVGALPVAGPPLAWLVSAMVAALLGAGLALALGDTIGVAFGAWVVAGPVAIGLLAAYTTQDTRERAQPVYTHPSWTPGAYWVVLVVAIVGIALAAWRIAGWAGRL